MSLLTFASRILCAVRHRRAVQSMTDLDDRALADIGLMRTDVHAALARPFFAGPPKHASCLSGISASRSRRLFDALGCC
jgi:uncharacterized protein YjiS (DUF1127 family)